MRNKLVAGGIIVAVLAGFCVVWVAMSKTMVTIGMPGGAILASVADTPSERARGLGGKAKLQSGEGMLLVYDYDARHGIWMKDMRFGIDIVWINKTGHVVAVQSRVQPSSYPKIYRPGGDARFVLELPAGRAGELGLQKGTMVNFPARLAAYGRVLD